jgi:rhodanese-related sulfurtransferase
MPVQVDTREAQELLASGAWAVDALPTPTWRDEHLPGARSLPLATLDDAAVEGWDRDQPLLVYCYDDLCDLGTRTAHRLEQMGFTRVFDYLPGRIGWVARGLPTEGEVGDRDRVGLIARRDLPRCRAGDTLGEAAKQMGDEDWCVVVDADDVVLGLVRSEALAMEPDRTVDTAMIPAPGTVRPHLRAHDLARQLDRDRLDRVLVTTAEGVLIGLVRREDLRVDG